MILCHDHAVVLNRDGGRGDLCRVARVGWLVDIKNGIVTDDALGAEDVVPGTHDRVGLVREDMGVDLKEVRSGVIEGLEFVGRAGDNLVRCVWIDIGVAAAVSF